MVGVVREVTKAQSLTRIVDESVLVVDLRDMWAGSIDSLFEFQKALRSGSRRKPILITTIRCIYHRRSQLCVRFYDGNELDQRFWMEGKLLWELSRLSCTLHSPEHSLKDFVNCWRLKLVHLMRGLARSVGGLECIFSRCRARINPKAR